MENKSKIITNALRAHAQRAIADGQSINQLAIAAGVERATLTRWLRAERTITLATAEALAAHFKLSLSTTTNKRSRGKGEAKREG